MSCWTLASPPSFKGGKQGWEQPVEGMRRNPHGGPVALADSFAARRRPRQDRRRLELGEGLVRRHRPPHRRGADVRVAVGPGDLGGSVEAVLLSDLCQGELHVGLAAAEVDVAEDHVGQRQHLAGGARGPDVDPAGAGLGPGHRLEPLSPDPVGIGGGRPGQQPGLGRPCGGVDSEADEGNDDGGGRCPSKR